MLSLWAIYGLLLDRQWLLKSAAWEILVGLLAAVTTVLRSTATGAEMLPALFEQMQILFKAKGAAVAMRDPAGDDLVFELGWGDWQHWSGERTIDQAISGNLKLPFVMQVLLDQIVSQLGVDAVAILLHDPDSRTLSYRAGQGFHGQAIEQTHMAWNEGLPGYALLEGRTINVPDLEKTQYNFFRAAALADEHFVSYFAVPLLAKGEIGDVPGTGLGLYIVKQAVDSYGGTIEVQSEESHGTTFIVELPLHAPPMPLTEA